MFALVVVTGLSIAVIAWLSPKSPLRNSVSIKHGGMSLSLKMDRTKYRAGNPITFEFVVKNTTGRPQTLKFANTIQFDVVVYRDDNYFFFHNFPLMWTYSLTTHFRNEPTTLLLPVNQSKSYVCTWNQTDYNGKQVPPGRYLITGKLNLAENAPELQLEGATY